jgi:hypothetical protein
LDDQIRVFFLIYYAPWDYLPHDRSRSQGSSANSAFYDGMNLKENRDGQHCPQQTLPVAIAYQGENSTSDHSAWLRLWFLVQQRQS